MLKLDRQCQFRQAPVYRGWENRAVPVFPMTRESGLRTIREIGWYETNGVDGKMGDDVHIRETRYRDMAVGHQRRTQEGNKECVFVGALRRIGPTTFLMREGGQLRGTPDISESGGSTGDNSGGHGGQLKELHSRHIR
jgi:hypothetical protein